MPKVEQYQPDQVFSNPTPSVSASPMPNGFKSLAKGIGNLGDSMDRIQMRADDAAATEAFVSFERDANNALFNGTTGYYMQEGKNAHLGADGINTYLEKSQAQYSDALKSPRAREAFLKAADTLSRRNSLSIMKHAATGLDKYNTDARASLVDNTLDNASLFGSDPEKLREQELVGVQTVKEIADKEGIDSEKKMKEFRSKFSQAAIMGVLPKSIPDAESMLESRRDSLEGPDLLKVEAAIEQAKKNKSTSDTASLASQAARDAVEEFKDQEGGLRKATESLSSIQDPEVYKAAIRDMRFMMGAHQDSLDAENLENYKTVKEQILSNGSASDYIEANPQGWNSLTATQQRQMLGETSTKRVTDHGFRARIKSMPQVDRAAIKYDDYKDDLPPDELSWLMDQRNTARKSEVSKGDQLGRTRAKRLLERADRVVGIKYTDAVKGDKSEALDAHNNLHEVFNDEVAFLESLKEGEPLSPREWDDALDAVTRDVTYTEGGLYNSKETQKFSDYSIEDTRRYTGYIRGKGLAVTAERLLQVKMLEDMLEEGGWPVTEGALDAMNRLLTKKSKGARGDGT